MSASEDVDKMDGDKPTEEDKKSKGQKKSKKDKRPDPDRFIGPGVNFRAKLIGIEPVPEARGDKMCQDAMQKVKAAVKASSAHKQKILINVSIEGLKILEEKSEVILHHHAVHKISFISQDGSDARAFGYVYNTGEGKHEFYGIKTDKPAEGLVLSLRDLFSVVYEMKLREKEFQKLKQKETQETPPPLPTSLPPGEKTAPIAEPEDDASSTNAPKTTTSEEPPVGDLLDLNTELSFLQQGIAQMNSVVDESPADQAGWAAPWDSPAAGAAGGAGVQFPVDFSSPTSPPQAFQSDPFAPPPQAGGVPAPMYSAPPGAMPYGQPAMYTAYGQPIMYGYTGPIAPAGAVPPAAAPATTGQDPFNADPFFTQPLPSQASVSSSASSASAAFSSSPALAVKGTTRATESPDPFSALDSVGGARPFVNKKDFFSQSPKPSLNQLTSSQENLSATPPATDPFRPRPVSDLAAAFPEPDPDDPFNTSAAPNLGPFDSSSLKPRPFESPHRTKPGSLAVRSLGASSTPGDSGSDDFSLPSPDLPPPPLPRQCTIDVAGAAPSPPPRPILVRAKTIDVPMEEEEEPPILPPRPSSRPSLESRPLDTPPPMPPMPPRPEDHVMFRSSSRASSTSSPLPNNLPSNLPPGSPRLESARAHSQSPISIPRPRPRPRPRTPASSGSPSSLTLGALPEACPSPLHDMFSRDTVARSSDKVDSQVAARRLSGGVKPLVRNQSEPYMTVPDAQDLFGDILRRKGSDSSMSRRHDSDAHSDRSSELGSSLGNQSLANSFKDSFKVDPFIMTPTDPFATTPSSDPFNADFSDHAGVFKTKAVTCEPEPDTESDVFSGVDPFAEDPFFNSPSSAPSSAPPIPVRHSADIFGSEFGHTPRPHTAEPSNRDAMTLPHRQVQHFSMSFPHATSAQAASSFSSHLASTSSKPKAATANMAVPPALPARSIDVAKTVTRAHTVDVPAVASHVLLTSMGSSVPSTTPQPKPTDILTTATTGPAAKAVDVQKSDALSENISISQAEVVSNGLAHTDTSRTEHASNYNNLSEKQATEGTASISTPAVDEVSSSKVVDRVHTSPRTQAKYVTDTDLNISAGQSIEPSLTSATPPLVGPIVTDKTEEKALPDQNQTTSLTSSPALVRRTSPLSKGIGSTLPKYATLPLKSQPVSLLDSGMSPMLSPEGPDPFDTNIASILTRLTVKQTSSPVPPSVPERNVGADSTSMFTTANSSPASTLSSTTLETKSHASITAELNHSDDSSSKNNGPDPFSTDFAMPYLKDSKSSDTSKPTTSSPAPSSISTVSATMTSSTSQTSTKPTVSVTSLSKYVYGETTDVRYTSPGSGNYPYGVSSSDYISRVAAYQPDPYMSGSQTLPRSHRHEFSSPVPHGVFGQHAPPGYPHSSPEVYAHQSQTSVHHSPEVFTHPAHGEFQYPSSAGGHPSSDVLHHQYSHMAQPSSELYSHTMHGHYRQLSQDGSIPSPELFNHPPRGHFRQLSQDGSIPSPELYSHASHGEYSPTPQTAGHHAQGHPSQVTGYSGQPAGHPSQVASHPAQTMYRHPSQGVAHPSAAMYGHPSQGMRHPTQGMYSHPPQELYGSSPSQGMYAHHPSAGMYAPRSPRIYPHGPHGEYVHQGHGEYPHHAQGIYTHPSQPMYGHQSPELYRRQPAPYVAPGHDYFTQPAHDSRFGAATNGLGSMEPGSSPGPAAAVFNPFKQELRQTESPNRASPGLWGAPSRDSSEC